MNLHGRTLRKGVCMKLHGRTQTRAEEFRGSRHVHEKILPYISRQMIQITSLRYREFSLLPTSLYFIPL